MTAVATVSVHTEFGPSTKMPGLTGGVLGCAGRLLQATRGHRWPRQIRDDARHVIAGIVIGPERHSPRDVFDGVSVLMWPGDAAVASRIRVRLVLAPIVAVYGCRRASVGSSSRLLRRKCGGLELGQADETRGDPTLLSLAIPRPSGRTLSTRAQQNRCT